MEQQTEMNVLEHLEATLDPLSTSGQDFWTGQLLMGIANGSLTGTMSRLIYTVHGSGFDKGEVFGREMAKLMRKPVKRKVVATKRKTKTVRKNRK